MRKLLLSALLLDKVIRMKKMSTGMVKIKASIAYLKAIKICRNVMLHVVGILICMILVVSGITVLHLTVLFYAPWPEVVRISVTVVCAILYIAVFGGFCLYLLSQKKWMAIFNADQLTENVFGKR